MIVQLKKWHILFWVFIFFVSALAQQNKLAQLRKEIQNLEAELKHNRAREKTLIDQIEDVEREIGLRGGILRELEKQITIISNQLKQTEQDLERSIQSYHRLQQVVAKRIVSMYKRGSTVDLEAILQMESMNQALVWAKYQKIILDNDERNLILLQKKQNEITRQKNKKANELNEKNRYFLSKKTEAQVLEKKKERRNALLRRERQDIRSKSDLLKRKREAFAEIQGMIASREVQRKQAGGHLDGSQFSSLKGKLDWPVNGRVVTRYGRIRDAKTKIWTENLGIDISTGEGASVRCPGKGRITVRDWRRGVGNLVIIEHGDGYYTVYGNLDIVLVRAGDDIKAGDLIGYVGDENSLNGSMLHFQVWKGGTHHNPLSWLKKKS